MFAPAEAAGQGRVFGFLNRTRSRRPGCWGDTPGHGPGVDFCSSGRGPDVVVATFCGWNTTKTMLQELLRSNALTSSRTWKDVLKNVASFALKAPFTETVNICW